MTPIWTRIRQVREVAGLSQTEAAERAGWSLQRQNNLESGRIPDPRLSTLLQVSQALGVGLDELVHGPAPRKKSR